MGTRDAVLFARERPSERGLDAEGRKVRTGDQRHPSSLATAITGIDVERRHAARGQQVDEDVGALPEGLEHRVLRSTDEHESIGIPHRQRLQENRVEQAEDGRGDADRQRQREDDSGGEARRADQAARTVARVEPDALGDGFPAHVVHAIPHGGGATQFPPRRTDRVLARQAGSEVLIDGGFEVGAKLRVELRREPIAPPQPGEPGDRPPHHPRHVHHPHLLLI